MELRPSKQSTLTFYLYCINENDIMIYRSGSISNQIGWYVCLFLNSKFQILYKRHPRCVLARPPLKEDMDE